MRKKVERVKGSSNSDGIPNRNHQSLVILTWLTAIIKNVQVSKRQANWAWKPNYVQFWASTGQQHAVLLSWGLSVCHSSVLKSFILFCVVVAVIALLLHKKSNHNCWKKAATFKKSVASCCFFFFVGVFSCPFLPRNIISTESKRNPISGWIFHKRIINFDRKGYHTLDTLFFRSSFARFDTSGVTLSIIVFTECLRLIESSNEWIVEWFC